MNVVTAAPAAAPRTRAGSPAAPAGGDDFAALLAGLGGTEHAATGAHEPADTAQPEQPLQDLTAQGDQQGLTDVVPPPALPAPPAAPTAQDPAGTAAALAAATTTPATTAAAADEPRPAGSASPAGPAAVRPAWTAALTDAPGTASPVPATGAPAPAVPLLTGTAVPQVTAPVLSVLAAVDAATTAPTGSLPGPSTTAAPEAVQLSVPAEVAGDSPVPVLDVRSTASPAGPTTDAQTAGQAVVEAVLPGEAAPAAPAAAGPPAPETAPTTAAPAAAAVGAEAGVAGPQPSDPRSSAPATPAAAPPPPPATQVVQLLTPVLAGPDGTYSLSLQLYPEELGAVQVEVLLRGGEIRLVMHAPDEAAQAALRSALPDLKADLLAGGLTATSLSVDDGRPGSSSDRSADRSPDRRSDGQGDQSGRRSHPYRGAEPASRPSPSHSDAALDLRM